MRFDKILYLNDVFFDPVEVANLLFSTRVDISTEMTGYRAVCDMDFVTPIKFYHTFTTRDMERFALGLPNGTDRELNLSLIHI